jgi:VWFA-related protein
MHPLRRLVVILAVAALAGPVVRGQASSAQSEQTFRSSVDLVTIQASVRDARGRSVQGLTTTDFEVRDNGELRPVLSLRADRRSPVSLAIVVDMSGSMRIGSKIAMTRRAYESVLEQLRDGEDEVGVFTFDSRLHEREGFTADLSRVKDALADFEPFGSTSLYDATAAAARRLADRSAAHKAVIVLTDGIDTSSTLTASEVSGLASSIDVPVYVVATVPVLDQQAMLGPENRPSRADAADLRDLAEWTGGRFVFASTLVDTAALTAKLMDELRQQYVLAIEAANTREWRRLDIRVKHPAATVKARSGYFGG